MPVWRPIFVVLCLVAAVRAEPARALPLSGQSFENKADSSDICLQAARRTERRERIPAHLLGAIALAESGRYDRDSGENFAWPWTVTVNGKGRYFDTKAEAAAEVEILLTQGIKNIDVGCMQVNLHYHWDAFDTLEDAFDPMTNAAYAAGYLKTKRKEAPTWISAAGAYHSTTPENARPYRVKVLKYWNDLRHGGDRPGAIGGALAFGGDLTAFDATTDKADDEADKAETNDRRRNDARTVRAGPADTALMQRLNRNFRARRAAFREDRQAFSQADRRFDDLNEWRFKRRQGVNLEATVARRLAEMEYRREQKLRELENTDPNTRFADRRRQQLDRWRRTGSLVGDGS